MKHEACPKEFRSTENVTGDHVFDASMARAATHNSDVAKRMGMSTLKDGKTYGPITGYDGYHGYRGDN